MRHGLKVLGIIGAAAVVWGACAAPGWANAGAEPVPILQVDFRYDADASPTLQLKTTKLKVGFAPQYDAVETGHVLSLHAENGDTLASLTFQIPNVIYGPPPQAGEDPGHGPIVLRAMDFSLTVERVEGAVLLRVADPQGLPLIEESLRHVPLQESAPTFRSLPHRRDRTSFWDLLMETAEAAGNPAALDVTFVGDNYAAADLAMFQADVDRMAAHLLTYEPYASRAGQVLFYAVDNTTVDLGCAHSATMDRLITCNNTAVTAVVNDAGAPYDKIIVLVKDSSYGGSGGAIAVSYNGSSAPQVVAHEFGHTLGGLLDEYNLYSTNGTVNNTVYVNCYAGAPPASAWDALSPQYALGCKYPNWYRPSSCSIMLSLSCPYFNAVSQSVLNTKLNAYAGVAEPSVTLSASPTSLGVGGSSTLAWTGYNVTGCDASGGWSGAQPTSGSATVTPIATTTYTMTCTGASSVAQSVTVTVDTAPPVVTLTSPANESTITGSITLSASATDNQQVDRVDFFKDGLLLGSDNTSPYGVNWNTGSDTLGAHSLVVNALDRAGNLGVSLPVSVTVEQPTAPGAGVPTVAITSPAAGSKIAGNWLRVSATATDDLMITRMELWVDGVLKGSSSTGSLSAKSSWTSVAAGAHSVVVKAFDANGNVGTASITVFK